jgi:hypothetical protein
VLVPGPELVSGSPEVVGVDDDVVPGPEDPPPELPVVVGSISARSAHDSTSSSGSR